MLAIDYIVRTFIEETLKRSEKEFPELEGFNGRFFSLTRYVFNNVGNSKYKEIVEASKKRVSKIFNKYKGKRATLNPPSRMRKLFIKEDIELWTKEANELADDIENYIFYGRYYTDDTNFFQYAFQSSTLFFVRDVFVYEYITGRKNGSIKSKKELCTPSLDEKNDRFKKDGLNGHYHPYNVRLPLNDFLIQYECSASPRGDYPSFAPSYDSKVSQVVIAYDNEKKEYSAGKVDLIDGKYKAHQRYKAYWIDDLSKV